MTDATHTSTARYTFFDGISSRPAASRQRTMLAAVYRQYGGPDVVTLARMPKPTPKPDEVLVAIRASTVNSGDWRARSLNLPGGFGFLGRPVFGFRGPRQPILGTEFAGVVEAVGSEVTRFRPGDEVVGFPGGRYGSHAEYRAIRENALIDFKPANLSFEQAAALSFGSVTALPFLRDKAKVAVGDKVLVVGASGAVGVAAVQIRSSTTRRSTSRRRAKPGTSSSTPPERYRSLAAIAHSIPAAGLLPSRAASSRRSGSANPRRRAARR
jgi:NADPH:quinone reductase-like Zn-dependent oxidoreductase